MATHNNLIGHIKEVHYIAQNQEGVFLYQCLKCDQNFKIKHEIRKHVLFVHETYKLFKCEICDKSLLSEEGLKDHNAAFHTKLKPYSCEKCGKSFSTNRIYKKHQLIHNEGNENFQCEHCGSSFVSIKKLKWHKLRVHQQYKTEMCDSCGVSFGSENLLKNHVIDVHGEKNHKCSHCEKWFSNQRVLNKHNRSAHVKNFKCTECDYSCNSKVKLVSQELNHFPHFEHCFSGVIRNRPNLYHLGKKNLH